MSQDSPFFKGADSVLNSVSPAFARTFGNHQTAVAAYAAPIAERLVEQYGKYPAAFNEALKYNRPEEMTLREAADSLGIHLYELAYGVPTVMADAFSVFSPHELVYLIKAREFEPSVLEMLRAENDYEPLAAGMFRDSQYDDPYALRAQFCSAFLGVDSAYALLQLGIRPDPACKDTQKVIDSIILGCDPHYAAATNGLIDPPEVVEAYRQGVAVEYLMASR